MKPSAVAMPKWTDCELAEHCGMMTCMSMPESLGWIVLLFANREPALLDHPASAAAPEGAG